MSISAPPQLRIWVLHGPNLNLLGTREPNQYGTATLDDVNEALQTEAISLGVEIECRQSNHEGVLVDWVHEAHQASVSGILVNPAALTHTSVALRDALSAVPIPTVEVHLSNIAARESFRHNSFVSPVAIGVISGFGRASYTLGLRALFDYLRDGSPEN